MNRRLILIAGAVLFIGAAAALFWMQRTAKAPTAALQAPPAPVAAAPPAPTPPAAIQYPVAPPEVAAPPLTAEQSDAALATTITGFIGPSAYVQWIRTDRLAHRVVATVDNLGHPGPGFEQRLVRFVGGNFRVSGAEDAPVIAPENAQRYLPLLQLLNAIDLNRVVQEYRRVYPLLQEAYVGLNAQNGYFNDRLVQVVDQLLDAPELSGPIALERPGVMYRFKDPALEKLTSGQKLLIRMGPAYEAQVKVRLRAVRALLTASPKT